MPRLLASTAVIALLTTPVIASETGLGAHEHGAGALNIAVEGATVLMEFEAPGADIVGFEYEAKTKEDRAKIDAAVATLAEPLKLFVTPDAAGCVVTAASVELIGDDHDGDHDGEHGQDDHAHDDDHAEDAEHADHPSLAVVIG